MGEAKRRLKHRGLVWITEARKYVQADGLPGDFEQFCQYMLAIVPASWRPEVQKNLLTMPIDLRQRFGEALADPKSRAALRRYVQSIDLSNCDPTEYSGPPPNWAKGN